MAPQPEDYLDNSPYQRIGTAWNELLELRPDLESEQQVFLNEILAALDTLLLALHPKQKIAPIPRPGREIGDWYGS